VEVTLGDLPSLNILADPPGQRRDEVQTLQQHQPRHGSHDNPGIPAGRTRKLGGEPDARGAKDQLDRVEGGEDVAANIQELLPLGGGRVELDPGLHEANGEIEAQPDKVERRQTVGGGCRDDEPRRGESWDGEGGGGGGAEEESRAGSEEGHRVGSGWREEELGDGGLGLDVVLGFLRV